MDAGVWATANQRAHISDIISAYVMFLPRVPIDLIQYSIS